MSNNLRRIEKETHITFNAAQPNARITTASKKWQKHIETLGIKPSDQDDYGDKEYMVPKGWIKPPRPPRNLSAEVRARRSLQMTVRNRQRSANRKVLVHAR